MYSICFDPGCELPAELSAHIVTELLKYLLYVRQQAPSTFGDLVKQTNKYLEDVNSTDDPRKKKKLRTSTIKKQLKLVETGRQLFDQITRCFQEMGSILTELRFLFGNSTARPREVYIVHISPSEGKSTSHQEKATLTRKLMQTIIKEDVDMLNNHSGPAKIFVMIRGPRDFEMEGLLPKANYKQDFSAQQQKRTNILNFYLRSPGGVETKDSASEDDMEMDLDIETPKLDEEQFIWYQSSYVMKGYALANTGEKDEDTQI
eukprot:TRINITY_DN25028_c0_g1_i1.p1 TRINITY_DN25028_c0_g1~~TRINITY_DN25028_c0_g1_i1.p1  ORF type:complete len:261 (+),score=53.01 TRINITY_DN25028_c0_g1_i1:1-783(+)